MTHGEKLGHCSGWGEPLDAASPWDGRPSWALSGNLELDWLLELACACWEHLAWLWSTSPPQQWHEETLRRDNTGFPSTAKNIFNTGLERMNGLQWLGSLQRNLKKKKNRGRKHPKKVSPDICQRKKAEEFLFPRWVPLVSSGWGVK